MHDRLGSYEKDAPEGLWEDICKEMSEMEGGGIQTKKPSTYPLWHIAGVAAAASVALFLGYSLFTNPVHEGQNAPQVAQIQTETRRIKSPVKTALDKKGIETLIAENSTTTRHQLVGYHPAPELMASSSCFTDNMSPETPPTIYHAEPTKDGENAESSSNEYLTDNQGDSKKSIDDTHRKETPTLMAYEQGMKHGSTRTAPSRWTVSTSAMGAVGASKSTLSTGGVIVATGPDGANWKDDPMLGINLFNQGKEVTTEYKHKLPVRIGLKVGYAINDKLSIESGLTFTRLSSDMKDGTKENYLAGEQRLNYVGIPIDVKYNALSFKRLMLYGTAGVLAEKCVSGEITTHYIIDHAPLKSETHTIQNKPLQMSLNATVGIQWDFLDNVGLYAEPGLSYYFDDHSPLQTIYKEKPLNFNINLGIRYTLGK